jgi:hypothetical protein
MSISFHCPSWPHFSPSTSPSSPARPTEPNKCTSASSRNTHVRHCPSSLSTTFSRTPLPFPPNHSSKSSPSSSILTTLTPTLHSRYRPCSLSNPRNRRLRNAPRNRHIQQHIQSLSQSRAGPPLPAHFQIRTPSHRCPRPIRRLKRFSSQKRSDPDPRGSFERLYCSAETKGRAVLESECSGREKMAWGGCPSRKVSLG